MIKKIVMWILIILITFSTISLAYEKNDDGNYEFTPEELKIILNESKQKDKIIDEQSIYIIGLEKELKLKDQKIEELELRITDKEKEIKLWEKATTKKEEECELLRDKIELKDIQIREYQNQTGLSFEEEIKLLMILWAVDKIID